MGWECRPGWGMPAIPHLCPHSRDLPPTRKKEIESIPIHHVNAAQRLG